MTGSFHLSTKLNIENVFIFHYHMWVTYIHMFLVLELSHEQFLRLLWSFNKKLLSWYWCLWSPLRPYSLLKALEIWSATTVIENSQFSLKMCYIYRTLLLPCSLLKRQNIQLSILYIMRNEITVALMMPLLGIGLWHFNLNQPLSVNDKIQQSNIKDYQYH